MAERRMFAKAITESDTFLDMPLSTQALYFHLGMIADDDGFVGSPKRLARSINASEDDLKLLLAKRFILGFNSGIVVIKHWKINNYLRSDRYKPTTYQEELKTLQVKENGSYTELVTNGIPNGIPNGNQRETQYSIGKYSIGKVSIDNIIKVYEEEIGTLTPYQLDTLQSYLDDLSEEMIIEAIKRASRYNKKSLKYIEGILKNWLKNGYKTLADIKDTPKPSNKEIKQAFEYLGVDKKELENLYDN